MVFKVITKSYNLHSLNWRQICSNNIFTKTILVNYKVLDIFFYRHSFCWDALAWQMSTFEYSTKSNPTQFVELQIEVAEEYLPPKINTTNVKYKQIRKMAEFKEFYSFPRNDRFMSFRSSATKKSYVIINELLRVRLGYITIARTSSSMCG